MKIKVCGMRDADNIRNIAQLDIDMMGFIFSPKSPRYVQMISSSAGIIPDYSPERLDIAIRQDGKPSYVFPKRIKRVGVFVDDMPQNIVTRVYNYNLDYVQLHGQESPVMIDNLRRTLDPDIHPGIRVIKAISIAGIEDVDRYKEYEGHVDLFLFDTKCSTIGGSGQNFDWSVLDHYKGNTPFLLSGGIGLEDAERVRSFHHDKCIGIDVNSKFEIEPAVKDADKLKKFIKEVKA
ncbi:MAG TPA: N-(5'-phosphoribosyl)anthranilate isomerase [Prevotella sp.]|nr:N-(5'-phosphoribosyl)anthranilate isomerase [Prevotella sp.]